MKKLVARFSVMLTEAPLHIIGLVLGSRLETKIEIVAIIAPIQYKVKYDW